MMHDQFSPATPDTGEGEPPKAGRPAFGNGPTWSKSAEGSLPVLSPFEQGYRDRFKGIEREMSTSLHHQDMHRAWARQQGQHPDVLVGSLAAELTIRNLIRAELGLEPIVPSGQLTLGDVA